MACRACSRRGGPNMVIEPPMIPARYRPLVVKAFSFGLIGAINAAVDFGVFSMAYYYFGTSIIVAQIAAWIVAVTGSYVMNSMITFAAESGQRLQVKSYLSFALAQVAGFLANTATVYLVSYLLERIAAMDTDRAVLIGKLLAIGASFAVKRAQSRTSRTADCRARIRNRGRRRPPRPRLCRAGSRSARKPGPAGSAG